MNQADQDADVAAVQRECEGEYVVALRPTINKFASMVRAYEKESAVSPLQVILILNTFQRPDIPVDSVHDDEGWVNCNWGIFGIHGIGKEVGERREDFQVEEKPSGGSWFGW